ncbi:PREDICTED: salutaridine reductase-like [Erythranthe guttata]|nr:PREDICTED: salutaridine reductase-like [Erythranthe guttata]|eukprot:XP_012833669.1 PREDICTED: salutaridine reductase-like [Erythranthe guttata]
MDHDPRLQSTDHVIPDPTARDVIRYKDRPLESNPGKRISEDQGPKSKITAKKLIGLIRSRCGIRLCEPGSEPVSPLLYAPTTSPLRLTFPANFSGPKLLTEALLPLFRRSSTVGRILNISSRLGLLNKLKNSKLKEILLDEEKLTEVQIEGMVNLFLENVKNGTWEKQGWPHVWTDYAVSKLALNAYSNVLAKRYKGKGISVNCFCPGFTQTSMTGGKGTHTADEAAEVAARLVLLSPEELHTGKFYVVGSTTNAVYSKL